MSNVVYHGTSIENWRKIQANGFDEFSEKIWSCSYNEVYGWDPEQLYGEKSEAIQLALESGDLAAATFNHSRTVVLEVEVKEHRPDTSAENMTGAVVFDPADVISVSVVPNVYSPYAPSLRLFTIACSAKNRYYRMPDDLNRKELAAIDELVKHGIFVEE